MIIDIRPTPVRISNPLHIFKQHKRNKKFHNSKIPIACNNKQHVSIQDKNIFEDSNNIRIGF